MPPVVNNVWANTAPSSIGEQITLPSGQTCVARRMDVEHLVEAGVLEQADSLTSIVEAKHVRKVRGGKGPDRDTLNPEGIMRDPDALRSILTVADRAIPLIVIEPRVMLHYKVIIEDSVETPGKPVRRQQMLTAEDRKKIAEQNPSQVIVYTDQIGLTDKLELFAWAMGDLGGLQTFRGLGTGADVGTVADGAVIPRKTKRTPRAKKS
jgi:hypothetical protein